MQDEAFIEITAFITSLRSQPWVHGLMAFRAMKLAARLADKEKGLRRKIHDLLMEPLAAANMEDTRKNLLFNLAYGLSAKLVANAANLFEPDPVWQKKFLVRRAAAYNQTGHPLAKQAQKDLARFLMDSPVTFSESLK